MPVYMYTCPKGHVHDELKSLKDRATDPCPECGKTAKLTIVPVHLDYINCGVDLGLPTAAAKWSKMQWRKNTGKQWDSNNRRYGSNDERR
jgi:putative FmdB family regulatory protein